MPRLSTYFIKSSFICLLLGFTIAGFTLAVKAGAVSPMAWLWRDTHMVLLIFGWFVQFTLGVAYWIFPRILLGDRGRPWFAWSALVSYQLGVACVVVSLLVVWWPQMRGFLAPGMAFMAAGIALFALHLLPRVRAAMVR